jgi:nucleotide-binding universal stress UspA family protein
MLLTEQERRRLRVDLAVEWGASAVEILRYASEHDIDLIAMGAHGQSGFTRPVLGGVADAVVREAPCAALTVRGLEKNRPQS